MNANQIKDDTTSTDFDVFRASLYARLRQVSPTNLRHLWAKHQKNTRIFNTLQNKRDVLAPIFLRLSDELAAQGIQFDELAAFACHARGLPCFFSEKDYLAPLGWSHEAEDTQIEQTRLSLQALTNKNESEVSA